MSTHSVAERCRNVRMMCRAVKTGTQPRLLGGLQVSLDMEKAFDTVSRTLVLRALQLYRLDPDLFQLVHTWLTPHKYCIPFKQLIGQIHAHRGIKQGAKDAPLLWTLTMSLVLVDLQNKYSHQWLHEHMVVYADDIHLRWIIRSTAQALEALTDLQHVLMTLQAFGFNVNLHKSVAMLRLQGKEAPAFLRTWVSRPSTGPVLTLPERRWQLPLVSKTAYLGVIIGYRAWDADTTARRITAAKWCFRNLRSWLVSDVHPIRTRLKLYKQCVLATVQYGIHEMGLTQQGFRQVISMINTHHRSIAHSPVCLTHESTTHFFERLREPPPWTTILTQRRRIQKALSAKRAKFRLEAMDNEMPDVCVFVPDLWIEPLVNPPDHPSPMERTQAVACPECHRTFTQAGTLKRHIRQVHQVPCEPDDVFQSLRDAWQGRSICTHCSHVFVDFYRLRDHINKHTCPRFDPAQESIVPIINRPDLKMHLRHKSVPGLLLNSALINEIANHCTFCHMRIAARSIRKHFTECHPDLVHLADHFRDHVQGMANIGGGRGRCSFCDSECRDTRTHECGVLFQISIMMGHTFQPEHFPIMPVMQKVSRTGTTEPSSISIPPPTPAQPGSNAASSTMPTRPDPPVHRAIAVEESHDSPSPLHACPHCHTSFLTATGLERHMSTHGHEVQADDNLVRAAKIPKLDTVPAMLAKPSQVIVTPSKSFKCPLCLEMIGRKALAGHLSKEHQVVKPPFFVFRPSRDMTPGRLACAHCHTTYTTEAALRLHYQRASCPILLIEWVKDQHFGPTVTPPVLTEAPEAQDPELLFSISGRSVPAVSALCFPMDTPVYTSDLSRPLLTTASMTTVHKFFSQVSFWPELRLRWFHTFVHWMAHLSDLPHLDLEVTLHHKLLDLCTLVVPCHWAWDSAEQTLLRYDDIAFHSSAWIQHFLFHSLLYELEHVLAQDWFHRCLAFNLRDGTYERRRSVFCRADGRLWQSLCQASKNRGGGQIIRSPHYPQGTEEAFALIGFGLGRRWQFDHHACEADASTRGPIEPDPPRQELHLLCPSRKRQHSATDAEDIKGLAWATGGWPSNNLSETTHVSHSVRGTCIQSFETPLRIKRSRTDQGPSEQAGTDCLQLLELSPMELQGEDLEASSQRSTPIRGSRSIDSEDPYPGGSSGPHSPVHSFETDATGFHGDGLSGGALETGHLTERPSSTRALYSPSTADRQRAYAADLRSNPTIDLAKVTIGSGRCSSLDEMRKAILALSLGNGSNLCYMNAALLAELWACCMTDTFVWYAVGEWKEPLLRLLSCSNQHQVLTDHGCLGQLLHSWFTNHEPGTQQDSAEFVGWLRHAMHGDEHGGLSTSKWEARLEAATEDSGQLYAPILLQQTKDGVCTIQDLINLWHDQAPFHCGFTPETTTVCLQVNRFPAMDVRSPQPIRWNRIPVHLPCFVNAHSWTVHWKRFEIVSVVVHRGAEPHTGHYQACLRTGGCRFLTEDWSRAMPCAHTPDLEHDLYVLWLVDSTHLTEAWSSLLACNPFVPFSSSHDH